MRFSPHLPRPASRPASRPAPQTLSAHATASDDRPCLLWRLLSVTNALARQRPTSLCANARGRLPPAPWDSLSRIHLTKGALRELDGRNGQSCYPPRPFLELTSPRPTATGKRLSFDLPDTADRTFQTSAMYVPRRAAVIRHAAVERLIKRAALPNRLGSAQPSPIALHPVAFGARRGRLDRRDSRPSRTPGVNRRLNRRLNRRPQRRQPAYTTETLTKSSSTTTSSRRFIGGPRTARCRSCHRRTTSRTWWHGWGGLGTIYRRLHLTSRHSPNSRLTTTIVQRRESCLVPSLVCSKAETLTERHAWEAYHSTILSQHRIRRSRIPSEALLLIMCCKGSSK